MARTSSTCAFLLIVREKLARSSIICCKVEHDRAIWGPVLGWQWPDTILWGGNLASCQNQAYHNLSLPGTIYQWILLNESLLQVSFAVWGITIAIATMSKEDVWIISPEKWTYFRKMPTMRFASVFLNDTLKRTKQPFETPNNATERSKIVWFFPQKERLPYHGHISCDSGDTVQTCPSNLGSGEPGPLRDRDIGSTDSPAGNFSALL